MSDRCQDSREQSSTGVWIQSQAAIHRRLLIHVTLVAGLAAYSTTGSASNCDRVTMLENHETSEGVPNGAICETFVGIAGAKGFSCFWAFSFRSETAELFFRDAWKEVMNCREGSSPSESHAINHPDSYDLRESITQSGVYRVAKKDKGQKNQTLIIMSFEKQK